MEQWYILDRKGEPMKEEELSQRPEDSNPTEGEAFRPWYKQDEHLHIEHGVIAGIHARGSLKEVQARLHKYLNRESQIIEKFGGTEDVLLPSVDNFVKQ